MKGFLRFLYNFIFFILIIGALAVTVINLYDVLKGAPLPDILISILCIIGGGVAACFLSVLLHETGHMLFGIFTGFKVIRFRIFYVQKVLVEYQDRVKTKNNFSCGSCDIVNTKDNSIKGRFIAVTAGGLLFAFLVFAAYMYANIYLKDINIYIYSLLSMGMTVSLYLFLSSFLPAEISGSHTDGGIILGLITNRDYAAVLINILKIQAKLYNGSTPSQIDKKLYFHVPLLSDDHISMYRLYLLRHLYYTDGADYKNAALTTQRLKYFNDIMPLEQSQMLKLHMVFDKITEKDYASAQEIYNGIKIFGKDITTYRIKAYYYYYAKNDIDNALKYCNMAIDNPAPIEGINNMEHKLTQNLLMRIKGDNKQND